MCAFNACMRIVSSDAEAIYAVNTLEKEDCLEN